MKYVFWLFCALFLKKKEKKRGLCTKSLIYLVFLRMIKILLSDRKRSAILLKMILNTQLSVDGEEKL